MLAFTQVNTQQQKKKEETGKKTQKTRIMATRRQNTDMTFFI